MVSAGVLNSPFYDNSSGRILNPGYCKSLQGALARNGNAARFLGNNNFDEKTGVVNFNRDTIPRFRGGNSNVPTSINATIAERASNKYPNGRYNHGSGRRNRFRNYSQTDPRLAYEPYLESNYPYANAPVQTYPPPQDYYIGIPPSYPPPDYLGYPSQATYYRGSLPPFYRERLGPSNVLPYPPPPRFGPDGNYIAQSNYPPCGPECAPYLDCAISTSTPNDCRSCVAALGGSSHCADQICGPHLY